MPKEIMKADLSVSSIKKLQSDLRKYQSELTGKCKEFVEKLAQRGITVAQASISDSPLGKYITIKTETTPEQAGCRAVLIATGKTFEHDGYAPFNSLLAVEFGSGIHYNPVPNPKADDLGFGVGTFPGQTHAFDENGWYFYDDKTDKWVHSYGVKATMPLYNASMAITQDVVKIAKEVF